MSPVIRHPKRRGEWVELQFMARAFSHGLTVSKPWGDSARYDVVVEHEGRFFRVQVKCTSFYDGRTYAANTVSRGPWEPGRTKSRSYTAKEIDFFAFYVIPEDIWYIIPIAVADAKYAVSLNPHDRHNKYFRFMEAWHLLKGKSRKSGRKAESTPSLREQLTAPVTERAQPQPTAPLGDDCAAEHIALSP